MNESAFNRMLYAIAVGLYEKEQSTQQYPYSNKLIYGLNLLSALALKNEQMQMLGQLHEAAFLEKYACRPVAAWFADWNKELVKDIDHFSLFRTGPLISIETGHRFRITDECADLCGNTENDLFKALEQNAVYQKMMELSAAEYTVVRKFIVMHPICTEAEIRKFKLTHSAEGVSEILMMAYEPIPENCYQCPECGWTMRFHGYQACCCNQNCSIHHPKPEQLALLDTHGYYRLKHGVMRYMCIPGKLELEIQKKAEQFGFRTSLWPEYDRYDIRIELTDGSIWAVDAKTHRNPYMLARDIRTDGRFGTVTAARKVYVVPESVKQSYPDYCDICNAALIGCDAECMTDKELYRELRKEKQNGQV